MTDVYQRLFCCGVSHKTLPLEEREHMQPPRERWGDMLRALLETNGIQTGVFVVTCNRVEFYLRTDGQTEVQGPVLDALGLEGGMRERVRESSYVLRGEEASRHLFRVAAGLDSMCIGETEVLGQIKDAYTLACDSGTVEHVMHRLFHAAFRVGKHVRNETELGRGVRSLAGAAIGLMSDRLGGLQYRTLAIVGVNKMTETVAQRTRDYTEQLFINRTRCKASALARRQGGAVRRYDSLKEALVQVDVAFTCTAAAEPILSAADLREVLDARGDRPPLVLCDLAVPRDVERLPEPDPRLLTLDLDDVQAHIETEDGLRHAQIEEAAELVEEHVAAFWDRMTHGELPDSAQTLLAGARKTLERELYYQKRDEGRSREELELLERFGRRLVEKVCGLGIANLRAERERDGGEGSCRATRRCRKQ